MKFAKRKEILLGQKRELHISTFLYALCVAAVFFIPYIISGKGYFLFYGDFNVQQIPFYQMCHQMVKSGQIGWNIYTDLGVNFIGSYSFYLLGSPFFWITLLFPNSMVPYLMGPLLILKFAFAALTAYFYLRRFTRTAEAARLGGLLYAFSGFSVYNIFFNHFHEAIILFPLLLLSVEMFMVDKRRGPFAFTVFLCALSNYFFFYGMVVFVVIYWFVRTLSKNWKIKFKDFLLFVFEAVLGVLCAAVLLWPTILALLGNGRLTEIDYGWNAWFYGKNQIFLNVLQTFFFPPDLPARPVFFPDAEVRWSSLGGWLPLFSMVGFVAFWQEKKGHWLRRVLGICVFMALVPILNSTFYMFNSAYYARWYYMPILLIVLMTIMSIEDLDIKWESALRWVFGITLATTLVIGFFPAQIENGKITKWGLYMDGNTGKFKGRYWFACVVALASIVMLWVFVKFMRKNIKEFMRYATAAVCIISVIYAGAFVGMGKTHSYTNEVMIDCLIEGKVELPENSDNYRIDVYDGVDNTGMYLSLPCINSFHSIVPTSVTEFYEFIGEERGVASRPETDSYAARSLLSVKYLLNHKDSESFVDQNNQTRMPGYTYLMTENDYFVYQNDNYIPYGFCYNYYMTKEQCTAYGQDLADDMMLKALLLDEQQIEKYGKYLKALSDDYYIPSNSEAGLEKPSLSFSHDAYADDCEKLSSTAASEFAYNKNGFSAKISLNADNLVFFAVPYDEGWSATVNGKAVEIERVNVGFMAVEAQRGECDIVFVYKTPGLAVGAFVSAGALVLLLCYFTAFYLWLKKHPVTVEYPEGDALLKKWEQDQFSENVLIEDNTPTEQSQDEQNLQIVDDISHRNTIEGGFVINDDFLKDLENNDKNS